MQFANVLNLTYNMITMLQKHGWFPLEPDAFGRACLGYMWVRGDEMLGFSHQREEERERN